MSDTRRLISVDLDPDSIGRASPDVEHERSVAIYDLLEENSFSPCGQPDGPYVLCLSMAQERLVFDVRLQQGDTLIVHVLSLTPFRRIVKDYFAICDSYYDAIKSASPARIEAIDMGRRGVHDEGSILLQERLEDKIEVDFDTARRLFTLVCSLRWKVGA